jgi:hypothetical protein
VNAGNWGSLWCERRAHALGWRTRLWIMGTRADAHRNGLVLMGTGWWLMGTVNIVAGSPAGSRLPGIYVGAGHSVSGFSKREPPTLLCVRLRPPAPHRVAPVLKSLPPRASSFTKTCPYFCAY